MSRSATRTNSVASLGGASTPQLSRPGAGKDSPCAAPAARPVHPGWHRPARRQPRKPNVPVRPPRWWDRWVSSASGLERAIFGYSDTGPIDDWIAGVVVDRL